MRRHWAEVGLTVGLANGCFDLLHRGHAHLIREAEECCDRLIIALNSDASVARIKGEGRPINSQFDRAAVIAAMSGVAAVIIFDEDTPLELIKALRPDVIVKGSDYAANEVVGADVVTRRGGTVKIVHRLPLYSTTETSERL